MTTQISSRLSYKIFIKLVFIVPLLCQHVNLVIGGEVDDDSLENALEAIERRQRDLQMRENYGQPENIGYGFQKNLGFFEPGPARHLGASREPDDFGLADLGFADGLPEKRSRSNFRERGNAQDDNLEYLQALRGLWERYQHQRLPSRAIDFEDLTDQEVAELLSSINDGDDLPQERHRNYRISENMPRKTAFGDGVFEKKNNQRLSHEQAPGDAFLYSLKWVNPAMNREGVEALRGAEPYAEDRDIDVAALLAQQKYQEPESWLRGPVALDDTDYGNEQRAVRRSYHGYDRKRAPVKRNANHAQKQTDDEVKGIFGPDQKKPTAEASKKPLPVKTKAAEKKVVRRAEPQRPGEINDLFRVQKKNIDWTKHFGVNKRMFANPFDTRVFNTNQNHNKRNLGDNLDAVENRINGVEDRLLEDAIKLTGARGDEGLDKIRSGVLRRIEAAYNLEKMRSSLEEFKNSVNPAVTDATPLSSTTTGKTDADAAVGDDKEKRVAVKKEGVVDPDVLEFLNWQRAGTVTEECPLLDQLVDNCVQMEEALGKFADLLTPGCTLHQICYTCGPEFGFSHESMCDLMFLSEAEHLCTGKPECLSGARDAVLALRETHERSPPIGTCRANPCIADFFVSSPSGVVYLPSA